jgi:two-component system, cell cycle sensor histidine kinase and response regulator CckA
LHYDLIQLTNILLQQIANGESNWAGDNFFPFIHKQSGSTMTSSATALEYRSEPIQGGGDDIAIRMAAGIAHDFGNVLTSVMARTESLLATIKTTDATYPQIHGIYQDIERASNIVHQLVDFAGGRSGDTTLLDVGEIVFDLAHLLVPMLGSKIEFAVVREPDLWTVSTSQSQLEMALMNLVKNARNAMPDGGQIVVVSRNKTISPSETGKGDALVMGPGQYVVLEVFDTGVGIPDGASIKIFEPFFTTKPGGKGSGLGLANVRSYFRKNGGDIIAKRLPDRGSVFRGFLPRTGSTL